MACDIEVHTLLYRMAEVEVGIENRLFIKDRPGDIVTIGANDATAAIEYERIGSIGKVRGRFQCFG